jgi:phage tail protein X
VQKANISLLSDEDANDTVCAGAWNAFTNLLGIVSYAANHGLGYSALCLRDDQP